MQRVSIVVSGGSSKGAYQIGFFKALKSCGFSFCIGSVSATSIGVINAYAYLTDKLDLAEQLWLSLNINGIWKFRNIVKNKNFLVDSFAQLIQVDDFISCDFYVTLSEMSTMTAQYFNLKGKMNPFKKKIMETSVSIPLLTFSPLQCNDKIYFDGGVTDNIPVAPILDKKFDILFVVHFTPEYHIEHNVQVPNADVIYIDMSQSRSFKQGNFNFGREQVEDMIKDGERYTLQMISEYSSRRQQNYLNKQSLSYYYFSGARLLSFLNYLFRFNKGKRVVLIRNIKYVFRKLYRMCYRYDRKQ